MKKLNKKVTVIKVKKYHSKKRGTAIEGIICTGISSNINPKPDSSRNLSHFCLNQKTQPSQLKNVFKLCHQNNVRILKQVPNLNPIYSS